MENFLIQPSKLRILIVSDLDNASASRLSEKFVPISPQFDAIIVCGPMVHDMTYQSKEEQAIALGDIASILAQLENIVCRVVFLPSEEDPPSVLTNQMHLTPNSIGIHGRRLNLTSELFVMGFAERGDNKKNIDPSEPIIGQEELENMEIISGLSINIIQEMLSVREETINEKGSLETNIKSNNSIFETGIFVLNYRYAHTLNQFLFHVNNELDAAGIDLCIISSSQNEETTRLPKKLGKLNIAAPKSLRQGYYTIVELVQHDKWVVSNIETCRL